MHTEITPIEDEKKFSIRNAIMDRIIMYDPRSAKMPVQFGFMAVNVLFTVMCGLAFFAMAMYFSAPPGIFPLAATPVIGFVIGLLFSGIRWEKRGVNFKSPFNVWIFSAELTLSLSILGSIVIAVICLAIGVKPPIEIIPASLLFSVFTSAMIGLCVHE